MIFIRPLLKSHWNAAENLWVETWQDTVPGIDFERRRPWFRACLPELRAKGFSLFGAFGEEDVLSGFIAIHPYTHVLDQIAVSVKARGRGVGAKLVEAAKWASPTKIILNVNIDNPRAIVFYQKYGFKETGIKGINILSGLNYIEMQWHSLD